MGLPATAALCFVSLARSSPWPSLLLQSLLAAPLLRALHASYSSPAVYPDFLPPACNPILQPSLPTRRLAWYLLRGVGSVCNWTFASLETQQLLTAGPLSFLAARPENALTLTLWTLQCPVPGCFQFPVCYCCVLNLLVQVSANYVAVIKSLKRRHRERQTDRLVQCRCLYIVLRTKL